jgi:class 3 adenylate cyclase/HAMP domain-containing protein
MQTTLTQQVIERGEAQVRSLAFNSSEELLKYLTQESAEDINIPLMQFVKDATQSETIPSTRAIPDLKPEWQKKILETVNLLNERVRFILWSTEPRKHGSDVEYCFIVDKNGRIVAHNDIQKVMDQTRYVPPAGVMPLGAETTLTQQFTGADGKRYYDIAAPIQEEFTDPTTGGKKVTHIGEVHLGMNQNTITRVVRYVAVAIIITTALMLILGIFGMTVFITLLVHPIGLLVKGVTGIAMGNYNQKIRIKRNDEIGDLTEAFNYMAKSLLEKEVLKGAFSKYVPKSVVERILQHQDGLKLGGEKKTITIFFSDIRGFTPMSEALSAEEVVHILNEYFTAMTAIIFKHEGTLDKFMGDAIMAVWGAPIDMPDHAERAVMAAVEMSKKMQELQDKWRSEGKREVSIGIGINTGDVVVGNIGSMERMEYTAIGDNVNLTQRLESVAEKGQILISGATYERVKHRVVATMLDPIKVKGKAEKVIAYQVEGLKP